MMIIKITKWLLLIIAFKMIVALVVAQFYTDPRHDITARKKLCDVFRPNVVFIGTSRTLYGIDPALFDSLNGQKTRSYNFGIFSISPYSSLQIAYDLLWENPEVKNIYIELNALGYSTVALQPQHVVPDVIFRTRLMADCPNVDFQEKTGAFLDGLNTTLFQMVSIAPQILAVKKAVKPENDPIEGKADLLDNGFQIVNAALNHTDERLTANKSATYDMLAMRRMSVPNAFYISQINNLISEARAVGKKVIFYMPNSITPAEFDVLSQVTPFLPAENLITLPGQLLDVLFRPANLFDPYHLNKTGAAIYTKYLQDECTKRSGL